MAPNKKVCLAVKANAYGHGAVEISRAAVSMGIDYLGVATVEEGIELRNAGIKAPVLLFGIAPQDQINTIIDNDFEVFVDGLEYLEKLATIATKQGKKVKVHLKVDTGMVRIGCNPLDLAKILDYIKVNNSFEFIGLCTHFPVADSDKDFTNRQIRVLGELIEICKEKNMIPRLVHAANSAGIEHFPHGHFDMVRPGLMAYGYPSDPIKGLVFGLKPVMSLWTGIRARKIIPPQTGVSYGLRWRSTKETGICVISIGYADGIPRLASGKFSVSVDGNLLPQVGTICMDQCMVACDPNSLPPLDAPVQVFGHGQGVITAQGLADLIGTIPYEILCGISARVPRRYIK